MVSQIHKSRLAQYVISILAVCIVAGVGLLLVNPAQYKIIAFLLLVTVSILAMFYNIFPVLLASVLSALIWDFFFIPPRFNFTVGTTEDRFLLLTYFLVASVNAVLTYKIRQVEKEARKKEEKEKAIKLYNTLFNSLSHELQTPIATIIGATDTLKDGISKLSDDNKNTLIDHISIAALRLNKQVDNLLSISRLESGYLQLKKDWCDINELIYSVVNKVQLKSDKHKIEIYIPEEFPLFKLDFGIMEQVLYNLINNAIRYTPDDSTIAVKARYTTMVAGHFDEIDISDEAHRDFTANKLIITVSDNGKGFPENEIAKVFDKFYRLSNSRNGGTGLGLSIVKGFVEAHTGKIYLRNLPTGGAEFTIEIPAQASYLNALKNE
jgi:two-component system sensor histidine kinase KdpD